MIAVYNKVYYFKRDNTIIVAKKLCMPLHKNIFCPFAAAFIHITSEAFLLLGSVRLSVSERTRLFRNGRIDQFLKKTLYVDF